MIISFGYADGKEPNMYTREIEATGRNIVVSEWRGSIHVLGNGVTHWDIDSWRYRRVCRRVILNEYLQVSDAARLRTLYLLLGAFRFDYPFMYAEGTLS